MIAVDRALVKNKLADLHKAVTTLRALQAVSFEEFASNLERVWTVEHGLQICIQIVLHLGNHLLVSRGDFQSPEGIRVCHALHLLQTLV
jgi:uncharacterized protein YutE (UPF0331/DUF86 family)